MTEPKVDPFIFELFILQTKVVQHDYGRLALALSVHKFFAVDLESHVDVVEVLNEVNRKQDQQIVGVVKVKWDS